MHSQYKDDPRSVMTLDAGGTSFKFSAIRGGGAAIESFSIPSNADNLERCLSSIVSGFQRVRDALPSAPVAISFAFPGPADYLSGIIGDLGNLPCFRGGIALGPMLEDKFGIPTFIKNDGDLFVYGEAIAGLLPYVNGILKQAGSPKQFRNLFGVTLGTGFGGGIVRNGQLFEGDSICAAEIWLLRNKLLPSTCAEESVSIRAVRGVYAAEAGIPFEEAPDPKTIFDIGTGRASGDPAAAREAFRQLGVVVGDSLAQTATLLDGLAVIGGGISGAWPLFLPTIVEEMNGCYQKPGGGTFRRLAQVAFNLEDPAQLEAFITGDKREVIVPGSGRKLAYDALPRVGVGVSKLGTSEAVAIGAYAFAISQLEVSKIE